MTYEIDMKPDGDLMVVTLRGRSHRIREITDFQVILDSCVENGSTKVLIDYRELKGFGVGAGEVFHYITNVNKLYFKYISNGGKPLRIVYLSPRVEGFDEDFAMTVVENFGFPVKLTFELDQALEWLGKKQLSATS